MDLEENTLKKVENNQNQNMIQDLLERFQIISSQVDNLSSFKEALGKRGGILESLNNMILTIAHRTEQVNQQIIQTIIYENENTQDQFIRNIREGSIDVISGLTTVITTRHKEVLKRIKIIEEKVDSIDKKLDAKFSKLSKKISKEVNNLKIYIQNII